MNLQGRPDMQQAYEAAVVAMLNATDCTEQQAEAFVDAMAHLLFTTLQTYIIERQTNGTNHH